MTYTATFTLTQGKDGMVTPSLVFDPLVKPEEGEAPAVYGYMAECALNFMRLAELVDEQGNWIDDESAEKVELNLSKPSVGTKH